MDYDLYFSSKILNVQCDSIEQLFEDIIENKNNFKINFFEWEEDGKIGVSIKSDECSDGDLTFDLTIQQALFIGKSLISLAKSLQ